MADIETKIEAVNDFLDQKNPSRENSPRRDSDSPRQNRQESRRSRSRDRRRSRSKSKSPTGNVSTFGNFPGFTDDHDNWRLVVNTFFLKT